MVSASRFCFFENEKAPAHGINQPRPQKMRARKDGLWANQSSKGGAELSFQAHPKWPTQARRKRRLAVARGTLKHPQSQTRFPGRTSLEPGKL